MRNSILSATLTAAISALLLSCAPAVKLPGVHEPLDSGEWQRCAGELAQREAVALIDDLTLDAKTLLCQGVVLVSEGKVEEGLDLLTESGVRNKEDHRPHYLAGRILAEQGRYEEALSAFEKSAKRFPAMEVPTERLGRKALDRDGPEEAKAFLLKANDRGLCTYGCKGLLAKLYHREGKTTEAESIYKQMIEEKPEEPAAYVGMAGMRNSSADYKAEAQLLQTATEKKGFSELNPVQQADILFSLAFARYNGEEYAVAARVIDRAISLKDNHSDWYILAGWIALKRDRNKDALDLFETAQNKDPRIAASHAGIGDAKIALNDTDGARVAYEKARELEPMDPVTILKLAYAIARAGDTDGARKLLAEAVRLDREHLPESLVTKVTDLIGGNSDQSGDGES